MLLRRDDDHVQRRKGQTVLRECGKVKALSGCDSLCEFEASTLYRPINLHGCPSFEHLSRINHTSHESSPAERMAAFRTNTVRLIHSAPETMMILVLYSQ